MVRVKRFELPFADPLPYTGFEDQWDYTRILSSVHAASVQFLMEEVCITPCFSWVPILDSGRKPLFRAAHTD